MLRTLSRIFSASCAPEPKPLILPLAVLEDAVKSIPGPATGDRHEDCARKWINGALTFEQNQRSSKGLSGSEFQDTPLAIRAVAAAIRKGEGETVTVSERDIAHVHTHVGMLTFADPDLGAFARDVGAALAIKKPRREDPAAHCRGRSLTPLVPAIHR